MGPFDIEASEIKTQSKAEAMLINNLFASLTQEQGDYIVINSTLTTTQPTQKAATLLTLEADPRRV